MLYSLDTSGLICPYPLLKIRLKMNELALGDKLEAISTDPSSNIDISVYARQTGNKLLKSWKEGDKFYYLLQKVN